MFTDKIQLETDERIIVQVRKHWFILATQLIAPVIAAFVPALLLIAGVEILGKLGIDFDPMRHLDVISYICITWLLLVWMVAFNIWTNYYLDVWTVTNKRLIAADQRGLFYRSVASFRLERLQDIEVEINGIIATFLDYGTLEAETASGDNDSEFKATGLPHPRELKATIQAAADAVLQSYKNPVSTPGL